MLKTLNSKPKGASKLSGGTKACALARKAPGKQNKEEPIMKRIIRVCVGLLLLQSSSSSKTIREIVLLPGETMISDSYETLTKMLYATLRYAVLLVKARLLNLPVPKPKKE